jgi:hypothetical protein
MLTLLSISFFNYLVLDINYISSDIRTAMIKHFFKIAGENFKLLRFFIFILALSSSVKAQPSTNLEIFYELIDSAASQTAEEILLITPEVSLTVDLGTYYTLFENSIFSGLNKNGLKVKRGSEKTDSVPRLNFVIFDAEVTYGEHERDGFLGSFVVSREVSLRGSYLLTSYEESSITKMSELSFSYSDKVKVEDIEKIENRSYPFTIGIIPQEPFFSSLLEPVIAVGAAALAVILFFSVRSK